MLSCEDLLPLELWELVLAACPASFVRYTAAAVCRSWRSLAQSDQMWRALCLRDGVLVEADRVQADADDSSPPVVVSEAYKQRYWACCGAQFHRALISPSAETVSLSADGAVLRVNPFGRVSATLRLWRPMVSAPYSPHQFARVLLHVRHVVPDSVAAPHDPIELVVSCGQQRVPVRVQRQPVHVAIEWGDCAVGGRTPVLDVMCNREPAAPTRDPSGFARSPHKQPLLFSPSSARNLTLEVGAFTVGHVCLRVVRFDHGRFASHRQPVRDSLAFWTQAAALGVPLVEVPPSAMSCTSRRPRWPSGAGPPPRPSSSRSTPTSASPSAT